MIELSLNGRSTTVKTWSFPGGERGVKIDETQVPTTLTQAKITCYFKSSNDIIDIVLLNNAIKNIACDCQVSLLIPYFPYARQDRVMTKGESFSLQVIVNMLKTCNFKTIEVYDPHSDVLAAMFDPGQLIITSQENLLYYLINRSINISESSSVGCKKLGLISPDAGALKKIYKVAKSSSVSIDGVICANKTRDLATGAITGTTINAAELEGYDLLYVVDDICDGGATFIELAKEIRKTYTKELRLMVTHGIFSKGKDVLLQWYDDVKCVIDLSKYDVN